MHRIVEARPLEKFKVRVRFDDNVEGVVDLSDVAGKGIFAAWNDPAVFPAVFIDPLTHTLAWPGGIDLCPDSLYAEVTGIDLHHQKVHA